MHKITSSRTSWLAIDELRAALHRLHINPITCSLSDSHRSETKVAERNGLYDYIRYESV